METNSHLSQGISALKASDRQTARRHLAQALREDPNNERAWQWMFNAAENDTEREKCLREILRINPGNEKARQALQKIHGMSDAPFLQSNPVESTHRPWYRSTAAYVILFFLFTPALVILVLTDKDERAWVKIVTSIQVAFFFIPFCVILFLTISGPLINQRFEEINRQMEGGSVPANQAPAFAQPQPTATKELTLLPPGSPLKTPGITIVVEHIEIRNRIEGFGDVSLPQNGRFAVLQMAVTNTGTSPLSYDPSFHAAIISDSGAFASDFVLSFTLSSEENTYPPAFADLPPGQTERIIAVYDISPGALAYALGSPEIPNIMVELNIP